MTRALKSRIKSTAKKLWRAPHFKKLLAAAVAGGLTFAGVATNGADVEPYVHFIAIIAGSVL
ncbi:hypothetical protein [Sphingobium sp. AP50]|uniref:hypothetical protein n=1 Tax=Sphingobium sp. AP50 TaxID=1884369 RepID=UPI000B847FF7|nr:hypothetical protein [Sphingobium sp. AP50]